MDKVGYDINNFSSYVKANTYGFEDVTVGALIEPIKKEVLKVYPNLLVDNLLPVIKISDYNKIASFYGRDTYTLNDDEFILLADYAQMIEYENKALSEGVTISINGQKIS